MVLITEGKDLADGEAESYADTSEQCLFYEAAIDGVPACVALEYMAQTMAFAVGARRRRQGLGSKIGFVLGSRKLEIKLAVFRRDVRYRIHVRCDYTDEEFAAFDCEILDESGQVVASATLTAAQPPDNQVPGEEMGVFK